MERVHLEQPWLDRLLPQGFPTHTSTLITGPGGSGKPLIEDMIVAAWLRHGGSVVLMSLQYPSHEFIISGLKQLAHLDLTEYAGRSAFIDLDASMKGLVTAADYHLRANLVIPDIWDMAIDQACSMVPDDGPGILVSGSALNLLLFSPSYAKTILARMKKTLGTDKRRTHLFAASTTAKHDMIAELEAAADNLMRSRLLDEPSRLYMEILRMKDTPFLPEEVEIPLAPEQLKAMKEVADQSRKRMIPLISRI